MILCTVSGFILLLFRRVSGNPCPSFRLPLTRPLTRPLTHIWRYPRLHLHTAVADPNYYCSIISPTRLFMSARLLGTIIDFHHLQYAVRGKITMRRHHDYSFLTKCLRHSSPNPNFPTWGPLSSKIKFQKSSPTSPISLGRCITRLSCDTSCAASPALPRHFIPSQHCLQSAVVYRRRYVCPD
jgi:hypothetical protein